MNILAIEKEVPNVDVEAFEPHLKAEASKVWELYQAGIYPTPDSRGCLMLSKNWS